MIMNMPKKPLLSALTIVALTLIVAGCSTNQQTNNGLTPVRLRLTWVKQTQFAGYIVAEKKGFYKDEGLDVQIFPSGPDLRPQTTVAAGTDDIGIGVPQNVIVARSNEVPLVIIAQLLQDSISRYVLKSENRISNLSDLRGKKVGLWLAGDEVEFGCMLKSADMASDDVQVIPQEFSVAPFLQDQYVLSQVTTFNELPVIQSQGYEGDKLQILSPSDYNCAIVGDMIFTTEKYIQEHPDVVEKFLKASLRGWQYALAHPDETISIVLAENPELTEQDQHVQLQATKDLLLAGPTKEHGLGFIEPEDYQTAERILFESGQITKRVKVEDMINTSFWENIPADVKHVE